MASREKSCYERPVAASGVRDDGQKVERPCEFGAFSGVGEFWVPWQRQNNDRPLEIIRIIIEDWCWNWSPERFGDWRRGNSGWKRHRRSGSDVQVRSGTIQRMRHWNGIPFSRSISGRKLRRWYYCERYAAVHGSHFDNESDRGTVLLIWKWRFKNSEDAFEAWFLKYRSSQRWDSRIFHILREHPAWKNCALVTYRNHIHGWGQHNWNRKRTPERACNLLQRSCKEVFRRTGLLNFQTKQSDWTWKMLASRINSQSHSSTLSRGLVCCPRW